MFNYVRMIANLLQRQPTHGLRLQHAQDQVSHLAVQFVQQIGRQPLRLADVLQQPIDVVTLKRVEASRQVVS